MKNIVFSLIVLASFWFTSISAESCASPEMESAGIGCESTFIHNRTKTDFLGILVIDVEDDRTRGLLMNSLSSEYNEDLNMQNITKLIKGSDVDEALEGWSYEAWVNEGAGYILIVAEDDDKIVVSMVPNSKKPHGVEMMIEYFSTGEMPEMPKGWEEMEVSNESRSGVHGD